MKTQFEINYQDLADFTVDLEQVDIDDALDRAMEESMKDLRDMIIEEILARGLVGDATPGNRGEGPPLSSERAWIVKKINGEDWVIRTHPAVSDRAFYLEFGTSGPITPNDSETLKFMGPDGSGYIYPKAVSGVDPQGFLQAAMKRFHGEGKLAENAEREVEQEIARAFRS